MELYELSFTIPEKTAQNAPMDGETAVYKARLSREAQEIAAGCSCLGLAVGMPYGFQLYTQEQWEDFRRRIGTFPSMMQRHMKPFFATAVDLEIEDENDGFPRVLSVPASLARYARMEEWPVDGDGAMTALLIRLPDGRVYVLRSDGREEFMETMCE